VLFEIRPSPASLARLTNLAAAPPDLRHLDLELALGDLHLARLRSRFPVR